MCYLLHWACLFRLAAYLSQSIATGPKPVKSAIQHSSLSPFLCFFVGILLNFLFLFSVSMCVLFLFLFHLLVIFCYFVSCWPSPRPLSSFLFLFVFLLWFFVFLYG